MHQKWGLCRIYIQRPMDENKHFIPEMNPKKPPRRLFWAIIKRLKLEKNLKTFRGKFSFFLAALVIFGILAVAAFFALKTELVNSESGSLFSLIFSDTLIVLAYYKYFILAVLESMPVVPILISFITLALVMFSLKFAVGYHEKMSAVSQLIKNK